MVKLSKDRLYYSISEVGEILNINQSTIRYWEKQFPELKPKKKTKTSKRKFNNHDIQTLFHIKQLLKDDELSINSAKEKLITWKSELSLEELSSAIKHSNMKKVNIHSDEIISSIHDIRTILKSIR
ncbi:MAG: MerR family transcriptional regulator [Candidatus Delongbacteria bacterium]|jgi:DNA-binding transcriptional MerR regulator|nr:MerR family transcriptional regulator [Candidatus Delongbacteria bacterium]